MSPIAQLILNNICHLTDDEKLIVKKNLVTKKSVDKSSDEIIQQGMIKTLFTKK